MKEGKEKRIKERKVWKKKWKKKGVNYWHVRKNFKNEERKRMK